MSNSCFRTAYMVIGFQTGLSGTAFMRMETETAKH